MADLADVENALVAVIANALFAQNLVTEGGTLIVTEGGVSLTTEGGGGTGYLPGAYTTSGVYWAWPPIVSGAPGTPAAGTIKLYRGWPESANLMTDLAAGRAHVSVFPESGMARNTTRYAPAWGATTAVASTLAAVVSDLTITFSGTPAVGQTIGVQTGNPLTGVGAPGFGTAAYAYAVQAGDTLTIIAAAVAALIAGASASGGVVTMPTRLTVVNIGMAQTAALISRQQQQTFRVSCWAPSPAARDAVAQAVDQALAAIELAGRFTTPDNSSCRLMFAGVFVDDRPSKDRVWRRDMRYSVEYPTLMIQTQAEMSAGILNLTPSGPTAATSPAYPPAILLPY